MQPALSCELIVALQRDVGNCVVALMLAPPTAVQAEALAYGVRARDSDAWVAPFGLGIHRGRLSTRTALIVVRERVSSEAETETELLRQIDSLIDELSWTGEPLSTRRV
jgi:hypothetical protein